MIITTYRCKSLEHKNTFWVLTEAISVQEGKKVVIHEYVDGTMGWASQFTTLDRAFAFWDCLERNEFDPKFALKTFKSENAPD